MLFSNHAKEEMLSENYGLIHEHEVKECIQSGEIVEKYADDRPYESFLVYGRTINDRPIHVVCAVVEEENKLVIITTYEPNPEKWINYKRRRR